MSRLLPVLLVVLTHSACSVPSERSSPEAIGPADQTPVTIAECDRWAMRKTLECKAVIDATPTPVSPDQKQPRLSALSLYDECVLFVDRRQQVATCGRMDTCQELADCSLALVVDDWSEETSPGLCDAVTLRHAGGARKAFRHLAPRDASAQQWWAALYAVRTRCESDSELRRNLADCVRMLDDGFAECVVPLVDVKP